MSICEACTVSDQEGCKYYRPASTANRCMYYREDFGGVCDNSYAQRGVDPPKFDDEEEKKEDKTTMGV